MPIQIWNKFKDGLGLDKNAQEPHEPLHVVTAALMIRVSITHEDISNAEKRSVLVCIQEHFDLEESLARSRDARSCAPQT